MAEGTGAGPAGSLFVPADTGAGAGGAAGGGAGGAAGSGGGAGAVIWLPTGLSRGPWDPAACHGGAPAALLARELERLPMLGTAAAGEDTAAAAEGTAATGERAGRPARASMRLARLTVEIVRPVPLRPLALSSEVIRPGRRISLADATLRTADDDVVVAMARALRIRTTPPGEVDLADVGPGGPAANGVDDVPPPLPPTTLRLPGEAFDVEAFHSRATEHRFAAGAFETPGPVFDWVRLAVPVVPGEVPSPCQRVAAAADFGNGVGSSVGFGGGLFINPDLTIHLWREPVGEWIGMESTMRTSDTGIGMSDSALWDAEGRIGRTNQSLLLDNL